MQPTSKTEMHESRTRGYNFSSEDCEKLIDIVNKYKYIIESKTKYARHRKLRDIAWQKIKAEFNKGLKAGSCRTSKNLKMKYRAIKEAVRKKCNLIETQSIFAEPLNPLESKVSRMMSQCANKLPGNDHDSGAVTLDETTKESSSYAHMEFLESPESEDDDIEMESTLRTEMDDARTRSDNLTADETEILVNLVHKYKDVMYNKKNGIKYWSKEEAWRKIKTEFNDGLSNSFRTTRELKSKYKAIKEAVRKKCNLLKANSGFAEPLDPLESKVRRMISQCPDGDDLDYVAVIVDDSTNESSSFAYNEFVETRDSGDDIIEMQSTPRRDADKIHARTRGNNFTPEESEKLVDLIFKYKDTVESKGNDTRQCKLKYKVWQKIETEFNDCVLESFRSNKALRTKYTSIKSVLRKKCSLLKADPINAEPLDPLESRINEMLQSEFPDKAPDLDLDSRTDESTNESSSSAHMEFVEAQESGEDDIETQYAARRRCLNYSPEESEMLIQLVDKYIDTIENKKNDGRQWKLKDIAWQRIQTEFNGSFSDSFRTSKMLRSKYESIKKNVRLKCSLLRTDPTKTKPLDPLELKVRRMICEFSDEILDNDLCIDAGMLCDSTNKSSSNAQIDLNRTQESGEDDTETQYAARKRCINYTAEESEKLIDLVLKYEDTVESRKNDIRQWKLKDIVWEQIKAEFNDTFPDSFRSSKMLRSKYETIKKGVRLRCSLLRTDPTKTKPLELFELRVRRIINKSEGVLDNDLDSHAAMLLELINGSSSNAHMDFADAQESEDDEIEKRNAARKRSLNYSLRESEKLVDLVYKYKEIVESKKNDLSQWKLKELTWKKIKTEFNDSFTDSFRNSKMLKSKYEKIKKVVRDKCSLLRADPTKAKPLDSFEITMSRILSECPDGAMDNDLDSDAGMLGETYESIIEFIDPQKVEQDEAEMRPAVRTVIDSTLNSEIVIKEELLDFLPSLDTPNDAQPQNPSSKESRRERDVLDSQLELLARQKRILEDEYAEKRKEWKFREEERNEKRTEWAFMEYERQAKRKEWEFKEYERAEKKKEWASKERERKSKEGMNVSTLRHNGHS